jgi:hypothetical protein
MVDKKLNQKTAVAAFSQCGESSRGALFRRAFLHPRQLQLPDLG